MPWWNISPRFGPYVLQISYFCFKALWASVNKEAYSSTHYRVSPYLSHYLSFSLNLNWFFYEAKDYKKSAQGISKMRLFPLYFFTFATQLYLSESSNWKGLTQNFLVTKHTYAMFKSLMPYLLTYFLEAEWIEKIRNLYFTSNIYICLRSQPGNLDFFRFSN